MGVDLITAHLLEGTNNLVMVEKVV